MSAATKKPKFEKAGDWKRVDVYSDQDCKGSGFVDGYNANLGESIRVTVSGWLPSWAGKPVLRRNSGTGEFVKRSKTRKEKTTNKNSNEKRKTA